MSARNPLNISKFIYITHDADGAFRAFDNIPKELGRAIIEIASSIACMSITEAEIESKAAKSKAYPSILSQTFSDRLKVETQRRYERSSRCAIIPSPLVGFPLAEGMTIWSRPPLLHIDIIDALM